MEEDQDTIRQKLQQSLAPPIGTAQLSYEIATLLKSFGRKIDPRVAAQRLAEHVASRFTYKSEALEKLLSYRPKELANLVHEAEGLAHQAAWEEIKAKVLPMIEAQKKVRRKITTQEERARRSKQAKNRYEHFERRYISKPGTIEREFSADSALLSLYPLPVTGACLDKIFQGGHAQMCGTGDSLQNLFGLSRKRLSMAKPLIRRGRQTFYDYRAVVACMTALLKQSPQNAYWIRDPARRRRVVNGILLRARQKATAKIRKAFEATLLPYLS